MVVLFLISQSDQSMHQCIWSIEGHCVCMGNQPLPQGLDTMQKSLTAQDAFQSIVWQTNTRWHSLFPLPVCWLYWKLVGGGFPDWLGPITPCLGFTPPPVLSGRLLLDSEERMYLVIVHVYSSEKKVPWIRVVSILGGSLILNSDKDEQYTYFTPEDHSSLGRSAAVVALHDTL